MQLNKREASALSRLFSAEVTRELGNRARSPLFSRLLNSTRIPMSSNHDSTVGNAFDVAFGLLSRSSFRDDYVYRSALIKKIVLGRHSLRTATLLNEIRAGDCKADLVVLNGTSTAYEIKSERDSLSRLKNQVSNYRRVFAKVNVVVSASHLNQVLDLIPDDVGVITLSERFHLQTKREASDRPERTSPTLILSTLRVSEAAKVLSGLDLDVPVLPNTLMRVELARIFSQLDPVSVHNEAVKVLRMTRSQQEFSSFVTAVPDSMQAASLVYKPGVASRRNILKAMETPLTEALVWN